MGIKGRETINIIRRTYTGTEDEYGNELTTITQIEIRGCLVGWGSTSDVATIYDKSIQTSATIYFPYDTALKADDQFILSNDKTYELDGAPIYWEPQAGSPIKPKTVAQVTIKEG